MKLPPEIEDHYVKEVLYNRSLEDLPGEEWKLIEDFEDYMISNYGRVKSLERWSVSMFGRERLLPEMVMKPGVTKHFNKYLGQYFYNIHCSISKGGKKTSKPLTRLVYYHFIEKFDMHDQHIYIETKDHNRLHIHSSNLKKVSASERSLKTFRMDRAKNRHILYLQPVSQYTTEGDHVADFESFYAAEKAFGIDVEAIYHAIIQQTLIAGAYRWFLQSEPPQKQDFIMTDTSGKWFNEKLWERLGKPSINKRNPPACLNLSTDDIPDEQWIPVPGFEGRFSISDKGRIKRWGSWNTFGKKIFQKERILPQIVEFKTDTIYSMNVVLDDLHDSKKKTHMEIARLLYYCFIKKFDLNDKKSVVINNNKPQWKIDLSKLILHSNKEVPEENKIKSVRIVLNTKKIFNNNLWKKLDKPKIDKKIPPAIMNLSLKDLPNERWEPLPGYEGKYTVSSKGRVKRLSGWKFGIHFFAEEQILNINITKVKDTRYLCFRLHEQVRRSSLQLTRILYYCFVEEFDLNDKKLIVINQNEPLWDINTSKLKLVSLNSVFKPIRN
ncbi:hypothetical protein DRF65_16480 [Chryseobacterium pennae]|uniref:NUMOD4 domain-containing protein n=1 Tax=Chryseobacterium pennae TaxID=2258962 RepID=A0A3D9C751_9FLAO|nr:NUMOD4 domain-containing protein [Chryseobacterium pennae]REC61311.1 hypothetical protein DRF65_16480 [Chryseobacterium pennae]